jgi:membrane protein YdbS with pleckstrin-like domain
MSDMPEQDSTEDRPDVQPQEALEKPVPDTEPEVENSFFADGVDYELDPNWVLASRLSGGIVTVVVSGVSLIGLLIAVFASGWRGPSVLLAFGGWLLAASALAVWALIGPALRYKRRRYRLNEMGLRIRRGLIWHAEISVPYSRIQHTDVSRGPVERSFGLSTLIVHTAGTENASVSVDGLPAARAYRIRDLLLTEVETDDAV